MKPLVLCACGVAVAVLVSCAVWRFAPPPPVNDEPETHIRHHPQGMPYSQDIDRLGDRIEEHVSRWISIPYTNMPMKCFGGKANYNEELFIAESAGEICPFGPVSRALSYDLYPYSIRVRIPFSRGIKSVCYDWSFRSCYPKKTAFYSTDAGVKVVLLTVVTDYETERRLEKEQRLAEEGLTVAELTGESIDQNLFRPLSEDECIVVFAQRFIAIRNKGETEFRGYMFK